MDTLTERILEQDTIAETEKILGKEHWSVFTKEENMFCLAKAMSDNQNKDNHLKNIGDTHFSMTWDELKALLSRKGFVNALTYEFEYIGRDETRMEEAIIYYHPDKGMVVYADSYFGKTRVNGGNLYAEIQANRPEDEQTIWRWLSTGGCRDHERRIYETSHDIREGLFSKLDTLATAGKFLPEWTNKDRFLWFVDYMENKEPDYDYKAITQSKIEKCPEAFRKIICR